MINNLIELNIEKIEEILNSRLEDDEVTTLKDLPTPDVFKDMEKATEIITKAIEENQKITIVGDYDVDGVVATSILNGFFQEIDKEVEIILPNRFNDGYGLSVDIIERIDTDLIITVDNGISAIEAGERAKERGISLVITDHHMCPKTLPYADAIVNPKQDDCNFPESNIAGATVAWYVVAGLKKKMNLDLDLGSFLDLMAFAILADAMPLKSINRSFVKQGIRSINKSSRPAIQAMKKWLEINTFTTNDIIFSINPR
ncbi:MAG: DHH family phosphoesterase, partial [Campylobacterales bacterium]|nr:DHH family phosphoesterase [Campylobacterales bacterium]